MEDTHDINAFGKDELPITNVHEWNGSAGVNEDRTVVYNRTTDEIVWGWYFKNHSPADTGGGYDANQSHINDVDYVGGGRLLLSPQNFGQAIVVDMEPKGIVERLGTDDDHDVFSEQHNLDQLISENGTSIMLVVGNGNSRVAEYAKEDGGWARTWFVGKNALNRPYNADRLPNGNTFIVDTLNHRVVKVMPTDKVIWEYYAIWGPHDTERVIHGDRSSGPTIRDLNANGSHPTTGNANIATDGDGSVGFVLWVQSTLTGTPLEEPMGELSTRLSYVLSWLRPAWMTSWGLFQATCAVDVGVTVTTGELYLMRQRLLDAIRGLFGR